MLYPQNNRCRTVLDISGFWEIKIDADKRGLQESWQAGFTADAIIGIPGSWNEQLSEIGLMNYVGLVWHQTRFYIPQSLAGSRLHLRFGSVDFHAKVWINGRFAGEHSGGFLPFELNITGLVSSEENNLLVVQVDNTLSHETIPQGVTSDDYMNFSKAREESFPATVFDFFAYGGIHRPVKILTLPRCYLNSVIIRTSVKGSTGFLRYETEYDGDLQNAGQTVSLWDGKTLLGEQAEVAGEFAIPNCKFWSPEEPHLYRLHFELREDDQLVDEYSLDTGVREVKVQGSQLLLNGKSLFLQGFGKHEDFAVLGKGLSYPLIIKDFQLLKWLGANSFRTSHYPYAEEVMQMADRLGFLVIDEAPAVSLNLKFANDRTLANHKHALTELIARDRNHPCVISWSIANEPGIWGEPEAISENAESYWTEIYRHVKKVDDSRPVTLPACPKWDDRDPAYKYCDFISVNRYWGWYEMPGDCERAGEYLRAELQHLFKKYGKPILVSEFGADTVSGEHATYPQLFTEEYQTLLIEKYFEVIGSLPFTIGEHIWNFADFRTAQHHRRVVLNKKGVFNRQREPKAAAFAIRKRWLDKKK